ncbi:L,D-transpeptidase family protein [Sphingomonas montana]|uniref:L,D-transpeptidase family protein n=1 Tax=Sphingomonas montana TaxID=1843236 RepID=UPI0009F9B013|nr:L,D-transpeptidase family protein [Sphingomonas montana]
MPRGTTLEFPTLPTRSPTIFRHSLLTAVAAVSAVAPASAQPADPAIPTFGIPAPALTTTTALPPPPAPRTMPTLSREQARQLAAMIDAAAAQGLRHDLRDTDGEAADRGDADLITAALDHARAVHSGRLDSSDFLKDWGLRPAAYDPWPAFSQAVANDRLAAWIASLPPPYAGYDGLLKGLKTYRAIEASGGWPTLAPGPDMTINASGARVLALRKRLAVEDSAVARSGDSFDRPLLDAVRRAQRRYGLNPSGIVSTQTLAALNVPARDRVRQIMANMERWRWLPQDLAKDRVQVNIAAAVLTLFDGDTPVASMKAVTGRPGDNTPMLQSRIHSIVINPPWNVPTSIATKELWPKEKASPGYFKRNRIKVIPLDGGGNRLQQAAGDMSALGRLKFDFDNPYSVYLHDTPAQAGFSRWDRLASHGCVRLEKPVELADRLLAGDPAYAGGVQPAIDAGETKRARLTNPVTVYLLYWTAFASAGGQINFRADPYDWDGILASKIEARGNRAAALASR